MNVLPVPEYHGIDADQQIVVAVYSYDAIFPFVWTLNTAGRSRLANRIRKGYRYDAKSEPIEAVLDIKLCQIIETIFRLPHYHLFCPIKGAEAWGIERKKGFVVLPGATGSSDIRQSVKRTVKRERRSLEICGIGRTDPDTGEFHTTDEWRYPRFSLSAKVFSGYSERGHLWEKVDLRRYVRNRFSVA